MERIEALKHVLQNDGYSAEEKTSALAALRDIAATAETFHERQTAQAILKELDGPVADEPLDEKSLRLVALLGVTAEEFRDWLK